jgi:Ser/Thr protein kinase RdoA (MazF antagonist)
MDNIVRVTEHVKNKLKLQQVEDINRKVLSVIATRDGKSYYQDNVGNYWRACSYISNGHTYDRAPSPEYAYQAARQFGLFAKMLTDLPEPPLFETIKDFHNGPKRFHRFERVLELNPCNRAKDVKEEIEFIAAHKDIFDVLPELVGRGEIPLRATHNDTKINNVVFDIETNEAICVIDLDTVMPGLTLFDFGDMVRTAAATVDEDEPDFSKMNLDITLFQELVRGFVEHTASFLAEAEKKHLTFACRVIIMEQAVRFLTDYLEGDIYYKTHRLSHNLDRTRTQIALLRSAMAQQEQMVRVIERYCF